MVVDGLTAAAREHDGAMVALIPTDEDAKRLALDDGESVDELHMTLVYLGNASDWSADQRETLIIALTTYDWDTALEVEAFGLAHWNPSGEYPCWVLNVGGKGITDVITSVYQQISWAQGNEVLPDVPEQHEPFAAHVCLTYTTDTSQKLIDQLIERLGPITFDRVRVAFAGEHRDIPLHVTLLIESNATKVRAAAAEVNVEWFIEKNHAECTDERPWAVVRAADGMVEGCHETNEDAVAQMRALLTAQAEERDEELDERVDSSTAATRSLASTGTEVMQRKDCPPGQHQMPDGTCMPNEDMVTYEGVAALEGEWTGDGRQFAPGSLAWEDLAEVNVPLQWQKETSHGGINDVTVNVGRVTALERVNDRIMVRGFIDTGSEDGAEVARRLSPEVRTLSGVSIVADDPEQAETEWVFPEGCPNLNDDDVTIEDLDDIEMRCFDPIGVIFHSGRIRALTLVDTPAFVEASISLVESESTSDGDEDIVSAVVTSTEFGTVSKRGSLGSIARQAAKRDDDAADFDLTAADIIGELEPLIAASHAIVIPDVPPAEWFSEPDELPPFGAITVTDEGRVYGLLGPRDIAHRSYPDKRVTVPMGNVDYTRWMNRPTIVQGGQRVATGVITMNCGHASLSTSLSADQAREHYENSCSAVATVRIGESKRGVWIAGALLHDVTPGQVARMLACQLSGDWRKHRERRGMREFCAALLVPVPGFPTAASSGASVRIDRGELVSSTVPMAWQLERAKKSAVKSEVPLVASVIGTVDLPITDRDREWDGDEARRRVFEACTDGDTVDVDCVSRAFLWRDPDANPETMGAYKLGFADIVDGRLQIVPRGVAGTAGGRGVDSTVGIPDADKNRIKSRICALYAQVRDEFETWPECPFERDSDASNADEIVELEADIPTWADIEKRREMRARVDEIAREFEREFGIEEASGLQLR